MLLTSSIASVSLFVRASDICGTVTNRTSGFPVVGASMSIADPSGDRWCCQLTDAGGRYLRWAVTPGSCNVSATVNGHGPVFATALVSLMCASDRADYQIG